MSIKNIRKTFVLAILIVAMVFVVACSNVVGTGTPQDTNHIVRGNGGIAVQYGNFVYFVNGYRGYDDDGSQNNDVVKGAIFRAELFGNGEVGADFEILTNAQYRGFVDTRGNFLDENGNITSDSSRFDEEFGENRELADMRFRTHVEQDYYDEDIDVATVYRVANRTVGTRGYSRGGIFIFNNFLYFATPSNGRDVQGNLLVNHTAFYRVNIHTGVRQFVYTTRNEAYNTPYAFYMFGGNVYLVTQDGTDIVSVRASGNNVGNPVIVAQNVIEVLMPYASIYYEGMDDNFMENFIFFTRRHDNAFIMGNVLEIMRPNGSQRTVVRENIRGIGLIDVRDGLLFYTTRASAAEDSLLSLHFDNLYHVRRNLAIERGRQASFDGNNMVDGSGQWQNDRAEHRAVYINETGQVNNRPDSPLMQFAPNTYTNFHPFRSNRNSNMPYVIASDGSSTRVYRSPTVSHTILNSAPNVHFVLDSFVYFVGDDNIVRRTLVDRAHDASGQRIEQMSEQAVVTSGLDISAVAGHLVFFTNLDEWANNYTFFKKISLNPDTRQFFVGERAPEDVRPEEEDDDEDEEEENGDEDYDLQH